MGVIEYSANNSGGSWWLDDDDWHGLEAAGWVVHWVHDEDDPSHTHAPKDSRWPSMGGHTHAHDEEHQLTKVTPSGERWLGALATHAAKETDDPAAAVAEWERVTGEDASAEGCNCCGSPHSFTFTDDEGNRRYTHVEVVSTALHWS